MPKPLLFLWRANLVVRHVCLPLLAVRIITQSPQNPLLKPQALIVSSCCNLLCHCDFSIFPPWGPNLCSRGYRGTILWNSEIYLVLISLTLVNQLNSGSDLNVMNVSLNRKKVPQSSFFFFPRWICLAGLKLDSFELVRCDVLAIF